MSADTHDTPRPLGEISQAPNALDQFLERHHKSLIALAVVIALGAVAYITVREIGRSAEKDAGIALLKADDLSSLQKLVKDNPDTAAAGSAEILLADKQWNEGQQGPAVETLQKFLASKPDHPANGTARASLGSKLASQGKSADAAKVFEELLAAENGDFLAPFALISLGDLARAAGDSAKAESYYLRAQNDFPQSTFGNRATSRIALLKAKPPVEIEAPPAPAPAPEAPTNLIPAPAIPGLTPAPEAPVAPVEPAPTAPSPAPVPNESSPAPKP
ncbi:MAG TPA: tetratricopeptide repeat protein [Luteolibacter sp.]|nr:tetratricopeptide repeat protein [Luteolibacter sp.]